MYVLSRSSWLHGGLSLRNSSLDTHTTIIIGVIHVSMGKNNSIAKLKILEYLGRLRLFFDSSCIIRT